MSNFFKNLLSDSPKLSHKRFIGIQSFYLMIAIAIVALSLTNIALANIEILKQIEDHLFLIVISAFFISGSENIVKIINTKRDNNDTPTA